MIHTEELKQLKELLDNGAITEEEFNQQKARLLETSSPKQRIRSKIATGFGIFVVIMICISIITSSFNKKTATNLSADQTVPISNVSESTSEIAKNFIESCPIEIIASVQDNIIGFPELKCNIKNQSEKEIAAIKLYFSPKNVYGEKTSSVLSTNYLYTDEPLVSQSAVTKSWQLLNQEVKSGELYIYSVYFSDGTEWGNKDASEATLKKYGHMVTVQK